MCPWSNAYSTRSGTSFDMCSRTCSASGVDLAKLDRYLIKNVNGQCNSLRLRYQAGQLLRFRREGEERTCCKLILTSSSADSPQFAALAFRLLATLPLSCYAAALLSSLKGHQ